MNSHNVQRAVVMDNTEKTLLKATNPDQIELAGLPRGLYFIRLYSTKGEHTQLVIKQ